MTRRPADRTGRVRGTGRDARAGAAGSLTGGGLVRPSRNGPAGSSEGAALSR